MANGSSQDRTRIYPGVRCGKPEGKIKCTLQILGHVEHDTQQEKPSPHLTLKMKLLKSGYQTGQNS